MLPVSALKLPPKPTSSTVSSDGSKSVIGSSLGLVVPEGEDIAMVAGQDVAEPMHSSLALSACKATQRHWYHSPKAAQGAAPERYTRCSTRAAGQVPRPRLLRRPGDQV
jgi:hypothetical protein